MPTVITGSDLDFTTRFLLNTAPKKFSIIDNTDYAGNGIPLTNVFGNLTIISPSGVTIYNNTTFNSTDCDVYPDNSTTQQSTVALPGLSNGYPEVGTYTITYTVSIDDGSNPTYQVSATQSYDYSYIQPTPVLNIQADCFSPLLTATDSTDYEVDGVSPTETRTLTLDPPTNSGGSPITNTTTSTITTSTFYTGLNGFTLSNDLEYVFSDGLVVIDTVTGAKSIVVDCSVVCSIICCLRALNNRMEDYRVTNRVAFNSTEQLFTQVMSKVILYIELISCGKQEDALTVLNQIKSLANCTDDCSCTDGAPRLVQGLGTQNVNVAVASGGTPITVTPAVVGGITTYTITLSSAFVNTVNNSYNTIVAAGAGISVTPSGTNPKTYTVTNTGNVTAQNRVEFLCTIEYTGVPDVTITNSDYLYSGSNIVGTATVASVGYGGGSWATANNYFKVNAFQTVSNDNFKVTVEAYIMEIDNTTLKTSGTISASSMYLQPRMADVEILNQGTGEFYFRFVQGNGSTSGYPYTNNSMAAFKKIILNIKISE